jgi:dienelactone hydrolase
MHKSGVIEYKHNDYACEGFAVWDEAGAKRPGILVFPEWFGVGDPVVPDDQTMAFWKEMRDAKANWEFVAYGNALHTFTNWLMPEDGPPPAVYNKQADRRSWIAMQDFFKEIFA